MTENLYAKRDHEGLGEHYTRHIDRMTVEQLHSKSAIAGELAWRDARIAALEDRLIKEAARTAEYRLRADSMTQRLDMCNRMRAEQESALAEIKLSGSGGYQVWKNDGTAIPVYRHPAPQPQAHAALNQEGEK